MKKVKLCSVEGTFCKRRLNAANDEAGEEGDEEKSIRMTKLN